MKLALFQIFSNKQKKIIRDYKQELLNKQGRDQLKKLVDSGMELPVVPL